LLFEVLRSSEVIMFYRFSFSEDKALLKVMVYGRVDAQSMRTRLGLLANDHRWKSEYKLLIDYSNVTVIETPKGYGQILVELLNEIPDERLPVGIAYVFPERLYCQCFDPGQAEHHVKAKCRVRFFQQEAAAVEWLEKIAEEGALADHSS
jgi:hypothetical protein